MTKKANEPRTLLKVPVSLHTEIKHRAWQRKMTMMDYLKSIVFTEPKEPRESRQASTRDTTPRGGQGNVRSSTR